MKRSFVAAVGLSFFLMAGNAYAANFDFQFYTTNPLDSSHICPDGVFGCPSDVNSITGGNMNGVLSFTQGSLSVDVHAMDSSTASGLYADYNPAAGGLGALFLDDAGSTLPEGPGNPDNLVSGQSLTFDFNQEVTLFTLVTFNNDHLTDFNDGADFEIFVDTVSVGSFAASMTMLDFGPGGLTGETFEFRMIEPMDSEIIDGIYISAFNVSTAIPEPGTAMLLGMGFVGLGAARRHRAA